MLLVATYWRTNLTMRQLAPHFRLSKSATGRIIDHLGLMLAVQPRKRFAKDTVLIVDSTLVPTRDHTIAAQATNDRYSTNHQVVIDTDTRLTVVVGRLLPGNRNDCKAWEESGAKAAVGKTMTIADGGYPGTGFVMPHRRRKGEHLPDWKEADNQSHKRARARVEHVCARMKAAKILRDCRLEGGDGVHHVMLGIGDSKTVYGTPLAPGRACAGGGRHPQRVPIVPHQRRTAALSGTPTPPTRECMQDVTEAPPRALQ